MWNRANLFQVGCTTRGEDLEPNRVERKASSEGVGEVYSRLNRW